MGDRLCEGSCRKTADYAHRAAPRAGRFRSDPPYVNCALSTIWRPQMRVSTRTLSPARLESAAGVETLQTLGILSGAGLLLSLLLVLSGWL
jgi:hypothetical protein